jgi:hypothetical protein
MVPESVVTCHVVPAAEEYCTDHPVTLTELLLALKSSMKSFLKVDPAFPPPPYTWLTTTPLVLARAEILGNVICKRQSNNRKTNNVTDTRKLRDLKPKVWEVMERHYRAHAPAITNKYLMNSNSRIVHYIAAEIFNAGTDRIAVSRDLVCEPGPIAHASEYLAIAQSFLI